MKYVLGDIHGEYDKFVRMLRHIDFKDIDKLYILGDCIDRGPDGIKVLKHIMITPNMELIWGNHEKMMMDYIENSTGVNMLNWFWNGGSCTNDKYDFLSEEDKNDLRKFINRLPYFKIIDRYILCHAGIRMPKNSSSLSAEEILQKQTVKDLLWIRKDFFFSKAIDGYTVIFGHTPVINIDNGSTDEDGEFSAWHDPRYKDKIGIDCAAHQPYGRLCCIRLDDLEEFYV
jgi:serine/threonine protein phosphatase 1